LHGIDTAGDRATGIHDGRPRHAAAGLGRGHALFSALEKDPELGQQSFGLALSDRARLGRLPGGILRSIAAVDGLAQGGAVVALLDGCVRLLQRRDGGSEFFGSVPLGSRSARRINGTLRLIHFAVRRSRACSQ
jgi:hypothetical protein